MKKLFDFCKAASLLTESRLGVFSLISQRGIRYQESLKWIRPEKKHYYDPDCSGDLVPMPKLNPDSPFLYFKYSKELETANEQVKKIFSLGQQIGTFILRAYEDELVEKVRSNPYDNLSLEARIAKLTAKIRYNQSIIQTRPTKYGFFRKWTTILVKKRKSYLKILRGRDYKKFEWLLDALDLEYKPIPIPEEKTTRKKSITLLAKLKVEQIKQEKLAELKKSYDEQKVPFLENKIAKLKEIKEKEKKYNLTPTVTDEDIEKCVEKLEKVKIEVAERAKRGYLKKVHPYFLEAYDKDLLWEKEKSGEKIRDEISRNMKSEIATSINK